MPYTRLRGYDKIGAAILCLMLVACSPAEQVRNVATHTPSIESNIFRTDTGDVLPLRSWKPAGKPKAIIIALHGFNDYSHAFEQTGKFLARKGYLTYAYDQRGFGESAQTGIWAGRDNLTGDAKAFVQAARARHPHTKLYLMGESMGGAVVAMVLAQPDFPEVDGAIFSAPALWGDDVMSSFYRVFLWAWAHIAPSQKLSGEGLDILASDNIEMLKNLARDPLFIKETRVDTIYGLVGLMDDAKAAAAQIKTPSLLLYGRKDEIIPATPTERFYAQLASEKTFACYANGWHLLQRDLQGDVVLHDIAAWLRNPASGLPSGAMSQGDCPQDHSRPRLMPRL